MDIFEEHHMAVFRAIHDRGSRLDSIDRIVDFAADRGIDADEFRSTFNSAEIQNKLNQADLLARRMRVAAVPTVIIDGRYLVRTTTTVGPTRMLDVMDYLVEKVSAPADTAPSSSSD